MPQQQSPEEKQRSAIRVTAKYSGMALQLFGSCLLGVFIGKWIDAKLHLERPLFAVFLTIAFLFGAFYLIYKQLLKD
jgi:F0F1-type ATP synthase assembly protein I